MYMDDIIYPIKLANNNKKNLGYPWLVCSHQSPLANQLQRGYGMFCIGGGCRDPTAAQQPESLGRNARWANGTRDLAEFIYLEYT